MGIFESLVKVLRMRKPGHVFLVVRKENGMLSFVLVLPPPGAPDVVARRLSYQIGGKEPVVLDLDGLALETEELRASDNEPIVGSLVDIDDAGNQSEPRDFEFVIVDTIPPPQPGELGVRVVSED